MLQIAVIGAGQWGSEHLKSLMQFDEEAKIFVVDPSGQALLNANLIHKQFSYQGQIKEIKLLHSLRDLDEELDLAILAIHAEFKREVIEKLLRQCTVKNMLLDPVVFQRSEDFDVILPLLERHNIKCWVNNPRRYYPIYEEIRKFFKEDSEIEFQVHGGEWGIGSLTLDFADLCSFIQKGRDWSIDATGLKKDPKYNFRKGIMEFKGQINGKLGTKSRFNFMEYTGKTSIVFQIADKNYRFMIHEGEGHATWGQALEDFKTENFEVNGALSGCMTHKILKDILKEDCDLSTLEEIAPLHIKILKAFQQETEKVLGKKLSYCPIS
ncbi:MAG: Gfo/Idh/MocA family oxidoreductase [SAR324 cluster bacterium]|nr:Gfo/Idh/MocA family oxidoreductase [SAR324 cluster bacterium]